MVEGTGASFKIIGIIFPNLGLTFCKRSLPLHSSFRRSGRAVDCTGLAPKESLGEKPAYRKVPGVRWKNEANYFGGVAERSIAPVLKTGVPKGTGGSNPSSSAKQKRAAFGGLFFFPSGNRSSLQVPRREKEKKPAGPFLRCKVLPKRDHRR
jgi:hypothetical protein